MIISVSETATIPAVKSLLMETEADDGCSPSQSRGYDDANFGDRCIFFPHKHLSFQRRQYCFFAFLNDSQKFPCAVSFSLTTKSKKEQNFQDVFSVHES